MRCEFLLTNDMAQRGQIMIQAMIDTAEAAGIQPVVTRAGYKGNCELLMTYGTGHAARRRYLKDHHMKQGKNWVGWDLGYWNRWIGESFTMRMTINHDHPQKWLRTESTDRWEKTTIKLRNDFKKDGHILVIGQGPKQVAISRERFMAWEVRTVQAVKAAYPGRTVIFRPKRHDFPRVEGVASDSQSTIDQLLKGASLAVMHHSNVGVDACIAGVPVVTEDGAASWIFGNDLLNPVHPTEEQRLNFLQSLAFWQWQPEEAAETWKYLKSRLSV